MFVGLSLPKGPWKGRLCHKEQLHRPFKMIWKCNTSVEATMRLHLGELGADTCSKVHDGEPNWKSMGGMYVIMGLD